MNATADSEENPERPGPGAPGLPLSAPVAATVLPARELSAYFREPDDRAAGHPGAGPARRTWSPAGRARGRRSHGRAGGACRRARA